MTTPAPVRLAPPVLHLEPSVLMIMASFHVLRESRRSPIVVLYSSLSVLGGGKMVVSLAWFARDGFHGGS
jgi:hypothetical protein